MTDATLAMPIMSYETSAVLPGNDAYERYFKKLDRAFALQMECLKARSKQGNDTFEATVMQDMLARLRYTTTALRYKHAFTDPADPRGTLHVDLAESGFPNHYDMTAIDVDLVDAEPVLKSLPSAPLLDEEIVRCLLDDGEDPVNMLAVRAKRAYLEMLDRTKLFLPFTEGPVLRWNRKEEGASTRGYVAGWGCYDPVRNMPFLHYMYFTQDSSELPFEDGGDNFAKFRRVIQSEGSHAPQQLSVLATGVDRALDPIHPKVIKRVGVGPLYTPLLINARPESDRSDVEKAILSVFQRADCERELALFFTEEIISSISQTQEGLLKRVVREVFDVRPFSDDEMELGATWVHPYVILPHRALQAIRQSDEKTLPRWGKRKKFGYDKNGDLHEIG